MNPFCPHCKVVLVSRWETRETGTNEITGKKTYGRYKVWKCPRCRRTWKKGAEIIRKKSKPKPRCFGVEFNKRKGCLECGYINDCGSIYGQVHKKKTLKKAKGILGRPPIKIIKADKDGEK